MWALDVAALPTPWSVLPARRRCPDPGVPRPPGPEPLRRPRTLVGSPQRAVHSVLVRQLHEISALASVSADDARPDVPVAGLVRARGGGRPDAAGHAGSGAALLLRGPPDGDPRSGRPALLAALQSGGLAVRVPALGAGPGRDLPRGLRLQFAGGLRPLRAGVADPLAGVPMVRRTEAKPSRLVAQLPVTGSGLGVSLPSRFSTARLMVSTPVLIVGSGIG